MDFFDNFVNACQEQELDPKFVAKECGVSKNTFGNLANGNIITQIFLKVNSKLKIF